MSADTPEAIRARFEAQQQLLFVVEAMLDGDYHDAYFHLRQWNDRRLDLLDAETKGKP